MKDDIGESLGLAPVVGEIMDPLKAKPEKIEGDVDKRAEAGNDYKYARENFYNVIEKGTDALEQMLDVARASEHPRAYEVVATLMKTLVDANKDLVDLTDRKNKVNEEPQGNALVTNNNLFVGSTSDLQKMLRDLRNDGDAE